MILALTLILAAIIIAALLWGLHNKHLLWKRVKCDVDIGTTFQFEVIREGRVIARAEPIHNVTCDDWRDDVCEMIHKNAHGGLAGADYLTVGSTDYTPAASDTTLT